MHTKKEEKRNLFLSVTLHYQSSKEEALVVDFSLSILSFCGFRWEKRKMSEDFSDGEGHGCLLISRTDLLKQEGLFMRNGDLEILCEIHGLHVTWSRSEHIDKLLELMEKQVGDITLCHGEKKFHVHKDFLCMYSTVFEDMLTNPMFEESKTKTVKIDDCDEMALKEMIRFVYTGQQPCFSNEQILESILYLAVKYQIITLKTRCLCCLEDMITVDNALSTLILAERYRAEQLQNTTTNFIVENFNKVKQTPQYGNFPDQHFHLLRNIIKIAT